MENKVMLEVRAKLDGGQNLFRRSTVEKMIREYERLLMRVKALEENASQRADVQQLPDDWVGTRFIEKYTPT